MTFVGALPDLQAFVVACVDPPASPVAWRSHHLFFPEATHVQGDVLIVASDEEGDEVDLDVLCAEERVRLTGEQQEAAKARGGGRGGGARGGARGGVRGGGKGKGGAWLSSQPANTVADLLKATEMLDGECDYDGRS